jgi:23S rRNA (uracil1939-C5)-methyltransferase
VASESRRTVELTIDSIAAGGDGVGRAEGLVVFVPRAAPGDAGRVRITPAGRFARGTWEHLRTQGPDRVAPRCLHYIADRCGGCQLQHLAYEAQLDAKASIVADAIERIARRPRPRLEVRASAREWRYRRKLTLALRRLETGTWIAGLHPHDAPGRVFDLRDCPITDERVLTVWGQIRRASSLLPRTRALRAAVRVLDGEGATMASLVVEGGDRWTMHERFFAAVPSLATLWWRPDGGERRRLHARQGVREDDDLAAVALDASVPESPESDENRPSATDATASFVQVNAETAADLHMHVVERTLAHGPASVIDAYAGGGDTSVAMAYHGVRSTAIELDPASAALAARRVSAPSQVMQGRVEDLLASALPADVVVLNPPRAGIDERVAATLGDAAASIRAVVYVSCNPATLARDLGRLPRFRMASLVAFDMFPQTAHVETVCELVPAAS